MRRVPVPLLPGFNLLSRTIPAPPCATEAGNVAVLDVNGDGAVTGADVYSLAQFLFSGGSPPAGGEGCVSIANADCSGNASCQ